MLRNAQYLVTVYKPVIDKPENKSLIHYHQYCRSYQLAIDAITAGQELVDDFEPRSDLCSLCPDPAVPLRTLKLGQLQPLCTAHLNPSTSDPTILGNQS